MKFKLDENLPGDLAEDLSRLGNDADTVIDEGLIGADDTVIVKAARDSDRILMTLDKGIANILRYPSHEHAGIVLFRPETTGPGTVLQFVRSRLASLMAMNLAGKLTIVTPNRVRIR